MVWAGPAAITTFYERWLRLSTRQKTVTMVVTHKSFNENDKVEVKLREFEVEILTKLWVLTVREGNVLKHGVCRYRTSCGENLNFKIT